MEEFERTFFRLERRFMKIFSPELIKLNYYALDKKSCLSEMVEFLHEKGVILSPENFLNDILERENLMSTGIGRKVAIPHARSMAVKELKIGVYLLDNELDFNSIDNESVKVIFMIAVPEMMKNEYMQVLSSISNFFRDEDNRMRLLACSSAEEVYELLKGISDEI